MADPLEDRSLSPQTARYSLEAPAPGAEASSSSVPPSSSTKKRGTFRAILHTIFSKEALQLMLSHHPNCKEYDAHVFKIGKLRLCKGCTLSYPPAYTIILLFIFWMPARDFLLAEGYVFQNIWWFILGFGFLTILGYVLKRFSIVISDFTKLFRGILAGFLVVGVFAAPKWYYKIIPAVLVFGGLTWLSLKRGKEMDQTCKECEWQGQFEVCPGFSGFYQRLNECSTELYTNAEKTDNSQATLTAEEWSSPEEPSLIETKGD